MKLSRIIVALLYTLSSNLACAQDDFSAWLAEFKQEAIGAEISVATIDNTLQQVELLPDIIELDHSQPEFISPFLEYYYRRVDARKIILGREFLARHDALLSQIETRYGVPKTLLVAFWGMETNFGKNQGDIDTFSALATLAYDGRRAGFFRNQLLDAMRMVESGHTAVGQLRGSWAGAFGNMQFMPTTFTAYAVDGDGDQKIDVANSLPDAFASAASYISQAGWHQDEPVMVEVALPENFAWQNAQMLIKKSLADWDAQGVRVIEYAADEHGADSKSLVTTTKRLNNKKTRALKKLKQHKPGYMAKHRAAITASHANLVAKEKVLYTSPASLNVAGQAAILLPQGRQGAAFMVFDNFDVIMDWNRSVNYALSVAQFAKRINQESRFVGGESAEAGALSFQQMFELQNMLNLQGFDAGEPDGFPGLQTQAAIRAYQLAQGLAADGYASPSLFKTILMSSQTKLTR